MALRSVLAHIDDMLQMIDFIRKTEGASVDTPQWMIRLAIERAFCILSEASRHIPEQLKRAEPDIPWPEIAGIGNLLRHDHQAVGEDILRNGSIAHLPALEQALFRLKALARRK